MSSLSILQSLKENILSQASVKAIYGDPIVAQRKNGHPSRQNNVCLWGGGGHWRWRCAGHPGGRYRDQ